MKLLILGATGQIGQHITRISLSHNHTLTLYVRSPSKLPSDLQSNPNITIITGSLTSHSSLSSALSTSQPDAIVSALGPSLIPFRSKPGELVEGYKNVLEQMRVHGVKLIYALSTPDIYHPEDKPSLLRDAAYWTVKVVAGSAGRECVGIGDVFFDEAKREDGGVKWVVYRVAMLTDGGEDGDGGKVRAGVVGCEGFKFAVRRWDCARWVVEEVEKGVEGSEWIGRMPVVWSEG